MKAFKFPANRHLEGNQRQATTSTAASELPGHGAAQTLRNKGDNRSERQCDHNN